jgi:hypothetical protein
MPNLLPNGIGGLVADDLITAKNLQLSSPARIWYVDSVTGDSGNSGKDRKFPLDTIANAFLAFSGDDNIIVCLNTHKEEISSEINVNSATTIVGEGATAGVPDVELTLAPGSANMFSFNQGLGCVDIRNLHFMPPGNAVSPAISTGSYIIANQPACQILGCHFDFDEFSGDDGIIMSTGSDYWTYENSVFTNVDLTEPVVARPQPAIRIEGAGALKRLVMCGCTFDGGLHGFDDGSQNPYAFDGSIQVINQLRILRMSLLRGADFKLHVDSTGYVEVTQATGHAKVEW